MYTVLLVDDEFPILETLKSSIPWQEFGVDTLLTAIDGMQALDKMKKQRVDLLITDIRMPNMDGLELLKEVRAIFPYTHCVLLTAYSDFEYAQRAIKLGVDNYLLKPFQREEMEETIEKALDNIYTSRNNSKELFRDNILRRWVTDCISSVELSERSRLLDINIYLPNYRVVCIKKRNKAGSLYSYCTSCIKQFSSDYEIYQFWDDKGNYVFIIGGKQISTDKLLDSFLSLADKLHVTSQIVLSIGSVVDSSEDLGQSYLAASNMIETADLSGCDPLILTHEKFVKQESALLTKELNTLFHQSDECLRKEKYNELAKGLLNRYEEQDNDKLISQLSYSLINFFRHEFPNQSDIQEQLYSRLNLLSAVTSKENLISAIEELLEYSYLLFQYYFGQLSPVIQYTLNYVHEHYADSLSIKEICAKNKMSTAYLGYLFKSETGMFFNNYLNQHRICNSIPLLSNSTFSIKDIAAKVGFSSTSYYISTFKKQTGLSPNKYRSLLLD
jgi:two-component system response regulator YesN